jgi:uncharacterized protein YegL
MMAINLDAFAANEPRALPVVLLLDVSGSMNAPASGEDNRSCIEVLNESVNEMMETFRKEDVDACRIKVSIVTFGSIANLELPFTDAGAVDNINLMADGSTAMGAAFRIAKTEIENRQNFPNGAYRPVVVLVSDGGPNDDGWEQSLDDFIHAGRTAGCDRWALAIGAGADRQMLGMFASDKEHLQEADNASKIRSFFRRISTRISETNKTLKNTGRVTAPNSTLKASMRKTVTVNIAADGEEEE